MLNDGDTETLELEPEAPETEAADEQPERLSVRDAIEKSWEKHGGELPEERKQQRETRRERAVDTESKPRDATGKFAKDAPGGKAADRAPARPVPATQEQTEATPSVSAPNGWSAEAKAEWSKLTPAIQAAVTKRESEMSAGAKQLQERYGGIHRLVQTLGPVFQQRGVTPDRGLHNLVSWFHAVEQNPVEGLKGLAKLYNIDVSKLGAAAPASAGGASNGQSLASDPRIDQLMRTVTGIEERGRQAAVEAELKAWSATKPHYEAVRQMMSQIVTGAAQADDQTLLTADGTRVDLDKVYDRAIWMVPEVRDKLLKEQADAERKKVEQERKDRAAALTKAKQAGSSVRPGTPGSGSLRNGDAKPKKGMTVRETITAAMAELRS